jgi:hypothetical protein
MYKTNLREYLSSKNGQGFAFVLGFFLFFFLQIGKGITFFPHDAGAYWGLADPAKFVDFPLTIRGYFYPLFLMPSRALANLGGEHALYPFRIFAAAFYSFCLTVVLPNFWEVCIGGVVCFWRRLVVPVLVALMYPGVVIYPLSDLPAFLFLVLSLYLGMRGLQYDSYKRWLWIFLSGLLAYGAYNTRTIYMFPVLCLPFLLVFFCKGGTFFKAKILTLVVFVAGALLASVPQAVINYRTQDVISPLVMTTTGGKSLFAHQLLWGLTIQRYETNIGPDSTPGQYFVDKSGELFVAAQKLDDPNSPLTVSGYFSLLLRHPAQFFATYARHVVNGFDLRDGDVYVKDIRTEKNFKAALNFFIIFIGIWILCASQDRTPAVAPRPRFYSQLRLEKIVWIFVILLPVFAIIPGAIETRFFLPAQVLIYCTIAFQWNAKQIANSFRERPATILAAYLILFAMYMAISLSTMATRHGA